MRARGLLVVAVVAGLSFVYGEYTLSQQLAAVSGAVTLAAIAAYATVNARPWPLVVALAALGLAVLLPALWYEVPYEFGWFAYGPSGGRLTDDLRQSLLHATEQGLVRYRWIG